MKFADKNYYCCKDIAMYVKTVCCHTISNTLWIYDNMFKWCGLGKDHEWKMLENMKYIQMRWAND